MPVENAVYVYWDEHLKGHAFLYHKPKSNRLIISDGVYDKEIDAENSAWFCCFATKDERETIGFVKANHCKTVTLH